MASLAVGTPWLILAGNRWPEYYFNGVPFYSVLPEPERFPAFNRFEPDPELWDDEGPRTPSMSYQRIAADLSKIVDGAVQLIERNWPFDVAVADHFAQMASLRERYPDIAMDSNYRQFIPECMDERLSDYE